MTEHYKCINAKKNHVSLPLVAAQNSWCKICWPQFRILFCGTYSGTRFAHYATFSSHSPLPHVFWNNDTLRSRHKARYFRVDLEHFLHCFEGIISFRTRVWQTGHDCQMYLLFTNAYTRCRRRNVQDLRRVFLMLKYTDINQNTYIQSWTVTEIMAREKMVF
jgi:hypothetical protein